MQPHVAPGSLRFGITWVVDDLPRYAALARASEEAGFDLLGVPDSQASTYRELYVSMTVAALNTRRAQIASMVTNPTTRHPAVTANALASLAELSGGRAVLGIATGDSAVHNLGLQPARADELAAYVEVVRRLWRGEPATYAGGEARFYWFKSQVPVLLGGVGPRALRLAGRLGDGVVCNSGALPEVITAVQRTVADGAAEAGRAPASLDCWFVVRASIEDDRATATRKAAPSVAAAANSTFRLGLADKQLRPELQAATRELLAGYDYADHSRRADDNRNAQLLYDLGLIDYMTARYGLIGTPDDCAEQLLRIARAGARCLLVRPQADDRHRFLARWRDEVLPAFARLRERAAVEDVPTR